MSSIMASTSSASQLLQPPNMTVQQQQQQQQKQPDTRPMTDRVRKSCDACQLAKVRCSQQKPSCSRCLSHANLQCVYSPLRRTGRPPKRSVDGTAPKPRPRVSTPPAPGPQPQPMELDPAGTLMTQSIEPSDLFEGFTFDYDLPFLPSPLTLAPDLPHSGDGSVSSVVGDTYSTGATSLDHSRRSTGSSCDAGCYASLLQQQLFLHEQLPDKVQPSLDLILQAEREARMHQNQVLSCPMCVLNPSILLLLPAMAERVIRMLEWIMERKAQLDEEAARLSFRNNGFHSSSSWGSSRRSSTKAVQTYSYSGTLSSSQPNTCGLPLVVGGAEIEGDEKMNYMARLLQLRIRKLSGALRDVRQATLAIPQSTISSASELVISESLMRLESLKGKIQLW